MICAGLPAIQATHPKACEKTVKAMAVQTGAEQKVRSAESIVSKKVKKTVSRAVGEIPATVMVAGIIAAQQRKVTLTTKAPLIHASRATVTVSEDGFSIGFSWDF